MTFRSARLPVVALVLLALAGSATGIVNGFTYDDAYIVQANPAMRDVTQWWRAFASPYWPVAWSGDGYRPITILAFKFQYLIGGGRPIVFHAANIALYALASVLVFLLARRLLPPWAAWAAAALFAVHPVHVEVVANVVGQSELLVAIFVVLATNLYLRDRLAGTLRPKTAALIALLYALACLAKEHGIVLPAILVAAELTVIDDRRHWRERVRALRPFYLVLILVAVLGLWARFSVLSNNPAGGFQPYAPFSMLKTSPVDRIYTAIGVVPEWLRLLYWPVRLSSEYGPPGIEIAQGFGLRQLPGLVLMGVLIPFAFVLRRRQPVVTFGFAFGCLALLPASNFLLPAGLVLAERTLFLPSVGAMITLGGLVAWAAISLQRRVAPARWRQIELAAITTGAVVVLAAGARSAQRSTVWRDNDRLFQQAAIDAPRSYRAHAMLGELYFRWRRLRDGEAEFRRAISMFPYDPAVAFGLAEHYRQNGLCSAAIPLYRWSHEIFSGYRRGLGPLARCLLNEGRFDEAKAAALEAVRHGADIRSMHRFLEVTDSLRVAGSGNPVSQNHVQASRKLPESVQKTLPSQAGRPNR